MRQRAHTPTARCCTRRAIGPVDVEGEASRCAMVAGRRNQGRRHRNDADSNSEPSGNRGSRGDQNRQGKSAAECWYCGKKGHRESECWKNRADSERTGSGSGFRHTDKGNLGFTDLILGTQIGVEVRSRRQVPGRGLIKHNVTAHARLFGVRVITLITLLLLRVADQDTFLGLSIQLPPFSFGACTYAMLPNTLKCRKFGFVPK